MPMTATKPAPRVKREMEIEALLHFAYRQELPKRQLSAQEARWIGMGVSGPFGPVDEGNSIQRYAYVGDPHPDAVRIERAVSELPPVVIDWEESLDGIMGDLAWMVSINDLRRERLEHARVTKSSWPAKAYRKSGGRDQSVNESAPRDVLMVGTLQASELVATHARQGTRPRWYREHPTTHKTPARNHIDQAAIIGESWGRHRYSTGAHCPIKWGIKSERDKWGENIVTPIMIAQARADYIAWWRGLNMLVETLDLVDHVALPPIAPQQPWHEGEHTVSLFGMSVPPRVNGLPLKPERPLAGRTRGQGEDVRREPGRMLRAVPENSP